MFKDINLIRLRDGCSGISMDLWFPTSSFITLRSQQHTHLITSYLTHFPFFYPLSVVIKSFMQQQMLNSGYSGLGSYGVLLMIVRFLQHQQQLHKKPYPHSDDPSKPATPDDLPPADPASARASSAASTSSTGSTSSQSAGEVNLGRVLCDFFRFYCTFDYATKAIDVRDDGSFFDKPEISALVKKGKAHGGPNPSAGDDDEDGDVGSEDDHPTGDSDWPSGADGDRDASLFAQYTLVIQDPQDPSHLIVGHHRALRNMVQAFMRALTILDVDTPLPTPPAALMTPVAPAAAAAAAVPPMFPGQYSLPPSSTMGRTTSDIIYPSALMTLPSMFPSGGGSPPTPAASLTPFQRLLDVAGRVRRPRDEGMPVQQLPLYASSHPLPYSEQSLLHLRLHVRACRWGSL